MDKQVIDVLNELGLEERETKIYLLLLKEGDSSALQIARKVKIDRTTIYDVLERLISKGLVSTYTKNQLVGLFYLVTFQLIRLIIF